MAAGAAGLWECAALAVILAPTDVSLSAAAVQDERVPRRVRHGLDAESALNEGAAVPLLLLFVAGATVTAGIRPVSFWATTAVEKIGVGALVGVAVGLLAGVAVAAFVFTQELGGSGLVAAFVAGLGAGTRLPREDEPVLSFAEAEARSRRRSCSSRSDWCPSSCSTR